MQATRFTGELGRLRAQELVRGAARYHELELNRRQREDLAEDADTRGGVFVLRRALAALALALAVLSVTAAAAFGAEATEGARRAAGGGRLDLTPALVSVLVLIGVALAAEVKRRLDRHA